MSVFAPKILAALLFCVLIFFATDKLTESPPTWFDEGIYLQAAINDTLHGVQVLQLAPGTYASTAFVTGGFPFLKPISWAFDLFGIGLLQARSVMVIFIVACVAVFFALAQRLFGWNLSLASLALLVTFPPLYGQGKNVLGEVPGLFFLGLFLFALRKLEEDRFDGWRWYVLAGLTAGLCLATKPIFFLLGGAVVIVALLYRKTIIFNWKYLALSLAVFFVPLAYWFMHQFSNTDSASAVAAYYANPYGVQDLNAQIFVNIVRFFQEASPMYFALILASWVISVAVRIWKKEPISVTESTMFAFAVLVSIAYLRTAGWYRYFFVAEIPALVLLPYALFSIIKRLPTKYPQQAALVLCALFFVIQCYQLLVGSWVAVHAARTTSYEISTYMQQLPSEESYFVYNMPAAVIFLPGQNYYQYLVPNPRMDLGREGIALLDKGIPTYLIVNDRAWNTASSTWKKYRVETTIDAMVIAKRI